MKLQRSLNIMRQEFRLLVRDRTFQVLAVIAMLFTVYTIIGAERQYHVQRTERQNLADTVRQLFEHQNNTAHAASHYGHIVFKPTSYLQSIDPGVNPFTGTTLRLEAHQQNEAQFAAATGDSSLVRFGEFSFSLLLQMVFPLMILFTCYRSVSTHRVDGTLKMLLVQGADMRQIIVAKIMAYTTMYWSFLVIAAFIYSLFFSMQGGDANSNFLRTVILLLVYAVYYLLLISVTVFLSARTSNSTGLLAGLLASWFILTVIVPKSTANFSARTYALPTRQFLTDEIRKRKNDGVNGHDWSNIHTRRFIDSLLKAYNVSDPDSLPVRYFGLVMVADEAYNNKLFDEVMGKYIYDKLNNQKQVAAVISLADPYMAVRNLSMAAAGTDMYHHYHFTRQAELYRRGLIEKVNQLDALKKTELKDSSGVVSDEFWKGIEEYKYQQPALNWVFQYYRVEIVSLIVWLIMITGMIGIFSNKIKNA